jgi:hypothetical protein
VPAEQLKLAAETVEKVPPATNPYLEFPETVPVRVKAHVGSREIL